jgi:probable rRNA maturation factor
LKTRIYLTDQQNKIKIDTNIKKLIQSAIRTTLRYEKFNRDCEVSVTIVDNETIHLLNKEQRGVDRITDVLSFPMFDDDFGDEEYCILGDIVLSAERAQQQAEEYGHSLERELSFLTVHSVLHLLGYDHELSQEDEKIMFEKQELILNKMGIFR